MESLELRGFRGYNFLQQGNTMFKKLVSLVGNFYSRALGLITINQKIKKDLPVSTNQKYGNEESIKKYWK